MNDLKNKTAVVTGAASGIGLALAHALGARGARLLLADVDAAGLQAAVQALRARGVVCLTQTCDVAQPAHLAQLAERAVLELQGADILINNAGVSLVSPVLSAGLDDAQWLMNINFWGVVHGCRAFAPQLQARPGCVIVNVSSIYAMLSSPTQAFYNASKAAVRAFSDALREELRGDGPQHPVQVLCVHPGGILTNIAVNARLGDISALAHSAEHLQSQFKEVARTSPEAAAERIVGALMKGRTRLLIGGDARVGDWLYRLSPARASAWFSSIVRARRRRSLSQAAMPSR